MKTKLVAIVAGQLCCAGLVFGAPHFVAHEWGTFTSVQGADGVQIVWNPLSVSELPAFVYDWSKAGPIAEQEGRVAYLGKAASMCLQRMETPVIYFYSDDDLTVNVQVNFPQGSMTEWYPKASMPRLLPSALGPRSLEWNDVKISPVQQQANVKSALRTDNGASHYYAARETDSDLLQIGSEKEKFLFYRGVGNFQAPLKVTQTGSIGESIALKNTAPEPLRQLFLYQRKGDLARFIFVPKLDPNEETKIALDSSVPMQGASEVRKNMSTDVAKALTREGLYEREAQAMVKTWDDSWFAEQGMRVFYALPPAWTDRVLPLTLAPKPSETVRVMVGRAELITPQMENDLKREIVRYGGGTPEEKQQAVLAARALGFGRFLEPTVRRLNEQMKDKTFAAHSGELLTAVTKAAPAARKLAAN